MGADNLLPKCKHNNKIQDKYRMRNPTIDCVIDSLVIIMGATDNNEADHNGSNSSSNSGLDENLADI